MPEDTSTATRFLHRWNCGSTFTAGSAVRPGVEPGPFFSSLAEFNPRGILPNYGVGLRFEFKHRMNIRIDYGFGKGTSGFVVQFAEAF